MIINTRLIAMFCPCKDRFDNFKNFYNNKDFTPKQFLGLKHISQDDKMWVCFRFMSQDLVALCAIEIAELVLPIFEVKYPNDKRPRLAIEAARSTTMTKEEIKVAARGANAAHSQVAHNQVARVAYAASSAANATYIAACAACAGPFAAVHAIQITGFDDLVNKKIRTIVLKYLNRSGK